MKKRNARKRIPAGELRKWLKVFQSNPRTVARSTRATTAQRKIESYLAKGTSYVNVDRQTIVDILSLAASVVGIWRGIWGK